jgi:hypothetical protein
MQTNVLARFKPHYDKIIDALRTGKLKADARGRLQIPSEYPVVSLRREAYVQHENSRLMVVFKFWGGRKSNMAGYLFSETTLADSELGHFPRLWVGPVVVAVEKRLDDHWYLVGDDTN